MGRSRMVREKKENRTYQLVVPGAHGNAVSHRETKVSRSASVRHGKDYEMENFLSLL